MTPDYVKQIAELDKALSIARDLWMGARSNDDLKKYYQKIDGLLDERMRLMKLRDAG